MLDLTVIILTKNEQIHIQRAIDNVKPIARRIIIVDSESTDDTCAIADAAGAEVVVHQWPGNQAAQFNWAIDNLDITTRWILRIDADEWLSDQLKEEMTEKLPTMADDVSAITLQLGRYFLGRRLRHGIVNTVAVARIFRTGRVRYENRLMDEHINILSGTTATFRHKLYDDNRLPLSDFIKKHDNYALREAATLLNQRYCFSVDQVGDLAKEAKAKRRQKSRYSRMPLLWRAFGYFCYRYFLRLGFLDGREGFLWDFLQGFWYRTLVDAKLIEIQKTCGDDPQAIREHLASLGIKF